ncbi:MULTISPECIES: helix-turn-helix domain-containing protein [Enterococcus]|uniref:XRE family transcriptional regulator n=1 Tax=Enterococcus mundtii TaxID=53346 RepID=A0AAI8WCD7_ENTMU|nr:helix-turn-helix transcriptional regulator [Enterococcus mundtii]MBE9911871.1 helix-turn-helix transcriptional regulator [Enterococcus mundtii]MCA6774229.1 helix-turn-helix transcriptional regulator [Enterococcus mundtii]MRI72745.1 helix-turn-helix transcriptional regulator [Enterococcus mundtii]UBM06532.1 helix-turn-helix transcriptional regulator [Enterococcus mundtii]BAO07006.1 XRE family transcriptional regulator [Enterococcus mundtii QU 25]
MDKNIIGQKISELRHKQQMTQEELAIKVGVSKQTISNWETGLKTPRMGAIQKIAELFHVTKGYIIEGEEENSRRLLSIFEKLNSERQQSVISFAGKKLEEQQLETKLDNEELLKEIDEFVEEYGFEAFENLHKVITSKRQKEQNKNIS